MLWLITLALLALCYRIAALILRKSSPDTGTYDPRLVDVLRGRDRETGSGGMGYRAERGPGVTHNNEAIARHHGEGL